MNHTLMRCLTGALLLLAGCGPDRQSTMVSDLIKEAGSRLAPDRRTAVFDVTAEERGGSLVVKGEIQNAAMKERLLLMLKENISMPIEDSLVSLPHPALGERTLAVVSQSVANLRTKPDHAAEMGTQVLLGTPLRVLKRDDGWYYVQTPEEYLGWTSDNIVLMTAAEYDAWVARPRLLVTVETGWVRAAREPGPQPVSDIVAGCIVALAGDERTHYRVAYPDGRTGYLRKDEAKPFDRWLAEAKDTPETIVATAKRFFGVPYFWGGTSAKGLDCSGFTKTVYYLNGVVLPRDASQQVHVGDTVETGVDWATVRPGDLLFFGTRATAERKERVTHVGISLGGRRFIHASGGKGVSVNSLDPADGDYSKHRDTGFLRVKRIIGAGEDTGVRRLDRIPLYRGHEG